MTSLGETEAFATMSVKKYLTDDLDVSRGEMFVRSPNEPKPGQHIDIIICWLNREPANPRAKHILMHTTNKGFAVKRTHRRFQRQIQAEKLSGLFDL